MDYYESEQEQIDKLKKWWQENGKSILAGLVIGGVILFGGRAWVDYQNTQAESASAEFSQISDALKKGDSDIVINRGDQIIKTYPESPYAAMSALAIAKIKVEQNELAEAASRLRWVLDNAKQPDIKHIARTRLARVMISQGENAKALALLENVNAENFEASYEEIKGDAYLAMNQLANARLAYRAALDAAPTGVNTQSLQIKLDNLGLEN